ncbi:NACHT domain-containing protein, partial [Streptomyces sp.]|uniref:NACHT domain-containing protein n=1 Tax=Streptomyces sp. TaxID=1931 RepID=UPI002F3E7AEB
MGLDIGELSGIAVGFMGLLTSALSLWLVRYRIGYRSARILLDLAPALGSGTRVSGQFPIPARKDYIELTLEVVPPAAGPGPQPPTPDVLARTNDLLRLLSPSRGRVFLLVGAAGTGKSTLLRHAALRLLESSGLGLPRAIPVLLHLGDQSPDILSGADLGTLAAHSPWARAAFPRSWTPRWLQQGRCVVFLDGMDEVGPEARTRVVHWLREQIEAFPQNSWVIASRPVGDALLPVSATTLGIRGLGVDQAERYVRRQLAGRAGRTPETAAREARELIRQLSRTSLGGLAANPLYLALMADSYDRTAAPRSVADVHRDAFDIFWRRQLPREPDNQRIVQNLALGMMNADATAVTGAEAARMTRVSRTRSRFDSLTGFLRSMEDSGILVQSAPGMYAFVHVELQEHLAADEILAQGSVRFLMERVDQPRWRGTTLKWAARADASPVIEACLNSGTARALALARDCAEVSTQIDPEVRAALARALEAGTALPGSPSPRTTALTAYVESAHADLASSVLEQAAAEGRRIGPDDISVVLNRSLPRAVTDRRQAPGDTEAHILFSAARLAAETGQGREANRYRLRGLVALAAELRAQSQESARDLCLAALTCLDPGASPDTQAAQIIRVYLGGAADSGDTEDVSPALHAYLRETGPAGFDAVVALVATSETAARLVRRAFHDDSGLVSLCAGCLRADGTGRPSREAWTALTEEWHRGRRALAHPLALLEQVEMTGESLREGRERLGQLRETAPAALELDGVGRALEALTDALDEWRFDQRDAALRRAERITAEVRAAIRSAPTSLAVELVEPAAVRIETLARSARRQLAEDRPPRPELTRALPSARLCGRAVTLQVDVANADGSAPVESGWLTVDTDPAVLLPASQRVDLPAAVSGGATRAVLVRLRLA